MHTFIRTVETDTAADLVWAYLADFTTINEWDPRASRTRRVEGDGGVGSSFETQVRFLGRTVPMRYEITRLEPYRRIEWRGSSSFVRAEDVIDVWSRDGRTVVDYTSSYEYQRAPRLMDRLMARPLDRLGDEARAGLDRTLAESSAGRQEGVSPRTVARPVPVAVRRHAGPRAGGRRRR